MTSVNTQGSSKMDAESYEGNRGKWFFLGAFIFACFLFWWLPSLIFRMIVHQADAVQNEIIGVSVLALFCFTLGYLLPGFRGSRTRFSEQSLDACGNFAYMATILIFVLALPIAVRVWCSNPTRIEGALGTAIPRGFQVVLYSHLFFAFMFLPAVDPRKEGWRRIWIATILVILPRLIISLHGGRFYLSQAVLPAILIAVARGWIRISGKRLLQFGTLAFFIIFVPALTRGAGGLADFSTQADFIRFFQAGSSLQLFEQNVDLNLDGRCPPLLVSLTAKTIPYGALGVCVLDISGLKNMPATLGRILTVNDPLTSEGMASGTGSNYMLDLYLFGGMFALYAGSTLFGFSCRRFMAWIGKRSLFAGIWAECLTRALFSPRNDLGYVFERIPSLVLATFFVVFIVWAGRLLNKRYSANDWKEALPG